ncbi:peptide ABC transporter substrate-binding protein [Actinomadura sp. CNU-125]|uniref:ABC transporter substrate-binding protein n=1 Tax=Actinomadura sp. CNU-125 TaxID=1904961 RepID=UPI000966A2D9|nr:ABC transporter substrate-binding protein [Actinomadura sp. CNU-125]OLT12588.1 peptide ABC transporter substrate-binding protein [Actinomadura sp. CNU-125]
MTDLPRGLDRRDFLRYTGLLGAAAAITASVSACSGPSSTGGSGGGTGIQAALAYSLSGGFDPMTASSAVATAANVHVLEPLVDLDPVTRKPFNALAKAAPEQVDDTTYKVALRDGATFHDGSKVTADDVVFSFERVLDEDNASLFAQFLPFVDSVKKVDAATVEFKLKYAFALFAERLSVVRIVPKKIVEADQKKFDALPVGSGPFKLTSASATAGLKFAKFDGYNGPRPAKVPTMSWLLITDPAARVTALQSDRVQAIEAVPYLNADALAKSMDVQSVQSFGLLFLMFNCKEKPFDDVRVRQALQYAIDTGKLIETALLGNASAATSFLQPGHPDFVEASTVYKHDPAKAKKLLEEAGATGLKVELVTTDTDFVKDCAPLIKQSWDAIGVQTTLDTGESGGQYANKIDTGKYQVMAAPGDPSVFGNDVDLLMRWFYVGTWPETRMNNAGTAEAKKVVELLDKAAREGDAAARKKLWSEAIDAVAEQAALYPIFHRKLPTGWNGDALSGFRPLATTGMSFLDVGRA